MTLDGRTDAVDPEVLMTLARASRDLHRVRFGYVARVRYAASAEEVSRRVTPTSASVEPIDDHSCLLVAGADHLDHLAVHLVGIGIDCEVLEPPELVTAMRDLAGRLARAAGG